MILYTLRKLIGNTNSKKAFELLYKEISKYRKQIFGGGVLIIAGAVMVLPIPFLMKFIIDKIIPAGDISLLIIAIGGMTVIHLLKSFQNYFTRMLFFKVNNRIIIELRRKLFRKLNLSDILDLKKFSTGYLISRVEKDPRHLEHLFGEKVINLIKDGVTFIVAASALLYLNWKLSVLLFIVVGMILMTVVIYGKKIKIQSEETFERMAVNTKSLEENLNLIETCKIFSSNDFNLIRYSREMFKTFRSMIRLEKLHVENDVVIGLIGALIPVVILGYGGYEIMTGMLTIGSLMAFMMFLGDLMGPASSILGFNIQLQEIKVALQRIDEILELPEEDESSEYPGKIESVDFRSISFGYDEGEEVMKDISFRAESGDRIGILGSSGAGKTTLMNIIAGLYDFKGDVLINNKVAVLNTLKPLRHKVSVVNQEPFLFNDTVAANITLSSNNSSVDEALAMACASDFVRELDMKEQTSVGENGNRLSVGQKQRIAIARALAKESDILIFDEPTANVDKETSSRIIDVVNGLSESRIVFIVAHKYESVKYCNKIILMSGKGIEVIGDYNDLMTRIGETGTIVS